ncbi:VanZ family protein [Tissierella pigra]|uniref:VanZ family protein n=1 Tax=Tissierella pigra TaxID=2607614 RepID=A0A6N7XS43_9FIRM|nr:VanZ family protein [Tissierella pigra]MSU00233.1 VanZ family protein [Tissierella pigra]
MNKFKITDNYKRILFCLAVIFWMALIFYLSSQPVQQSNGLSKKITKVVVDTIEKIVPKAELNPKRVNHILRKNAHFFAYLLLGILVMSMLKIAKVHITKAVILALIICIIYAISDEFHQLFVPGRGAQIKDVIIDTAGAITGIILQVSITKRLSK